MKNILIIVWLFCCTVGFAQQKTKLSGKLLNTNNQPIENVNVSYLNDSEEALTDENGIFTIIYKPNDTLSFYHEDYLPHHVKTSNSDFLFTTLSYLPEMEELVINTYRNSISHSLKDNTNTQSMNKNELLKAACCNLAESFETNPAIDVNFSDAITGTKQIKMLGLTSPYILIAEENTPAVRGASQAFGLSFIPGTWVESIQVTKGAGSVVNGFESISGQINYELLKPAFDDPFYLNLFGSQDSRFEINAHFNEKISKKWSTLFFAHGNLRTKKNDKNNDGFLDNPLGNQINVMNRWQFLDKNWVSFITLKYMKDYKQTGEVNFEPKNRNLFKHWGSEIQTNKFDANTKVGYVFPDRPYESIGWQNAFSFYEQDSYFGKNTYYIQQKSLYSNLVFSSIITNTKHKFTTGLSFAYDDYKENLHNYTTQNYDRTDYSLGAYYEYTYDNLDNLGIVAGIRTDYSNQLGLFVTPRLHLRYNPWKDAVIRASAGRGKRLANIFAENQYLFASSRAFEILGNDNQPYNLKPEIAWNYGLSFSQEFYLFNKKSAFTLDFYRTDFQNQTVIDIDQSAKKVLFYNLNGESFANSLQVEFDYNIAKHFNLRSAYKYYDIQTTYHNKLMQKPLQAQHRMFANLEYQTHLTPKQGSWKFDFTWNWLGTQRLPYTGDLSTENQLPTYSDAFSTFNAQITKIFNEQFEVYIGGENLSDYKQNRAIIGASQPFGKEFDSSIIYSPIFGRMLYAGLRFRVK